MKRILTLLGVCSALGFAAPSAGAQTITSHSLYDSCMGWNATASISSYMTITGAASGCVIESNYGDGSPMDTNVVSGSGTSYYSYLGHAYTMGGTYTIRQVLICGGLRKDSVIKSQTITCAYIGGNIYNDLNANCNYNTPTEPLIYSPMQIEVDSAGTVVDTVYGWGVWQYRVRATATTVYKFKLLNTPTGYVKTCPTSGIITTTYNPGFSIHPPQNFGLSCTSTPTYDYSLYFQRALRGSSSTGSSYIGLHAYNSSCHVGTGTVTLHVSPKYNITTSGILPTPTSVSGRTITWTIPNMSNSSTSTYLYVPLTPLSTTNNGDTACNTATITTTNDGNLTNNTVGGCDSVRASWDPNEKSVASNGPVAAGATLTYTIDFENLGNDTAFNIHIQDTLSSNLEANSFKLLGSTHKVIPIMYEIPGGQKILKFDFPGINLEDKSKPNHNKGQVKFSMALKAGLAKGTVTTNRAGIYFDNNPVVLTNHAFAKIPAPSGVPGAGQGTGVSIFPNPVNDAITIRVQQSGWNEAVLSNAVGQTVSRITLSVGDNVLRMNTLPPGIYYLQTSGSAGARTEKIEKQ